MTFWQFFSKTRTEEKEVMPDIEDKEEAMPINIYWLDHNGKIDAAIEKFKRDVGTSKKKKRKVSDGCSTYEFENISGRRFAIILTEMRMTIVDELEAYDICKRGDGTAPNLIAEFKEWLESFQYENTKSDLDKYLEAP